MDSRPAMDNKFKEKLATIAQMPHHAGLCNGTYTGCSCHVNLARQLLLRLENDNDDEIPTVVTWQGIEAFHPWRRDKGKAVPSG